MNLGDLTKIKVLYYLYKAVTNMVQESINNLHYIKSLGYIKMNKKRVQEKINNNEILNVVFVVQYIPAWNKLELIYSKMKKDDRFNPVIVCVPLNIQNHKLMDNKGNDTYEYFINHGYDAIDALESDGNWYDLNRLNPDYLFHSRPYNYSMPEPYTSGKIVKHALICNVIYGTCLTVNGLDVTLNKNYFRDTYMYYAFDKHEKDFYANRYKLGVKSGIQKCLLFGSIGMEQMLDAKKEKLKNEFKKTILWTPRWSTDPYVGGSNFFNYKDVLIRLAKDNQNILFMFRPHPLMFGNFIKTGEMTQKEVDDFKQYCKKEKNIILDESKEYSDIFWNSDILITDASGIVPEYFITEKPIIYCHPHGLFEYAEYAKDMIKSCYEVNNVNDLYLHFSNLINGDDSKLNQRVACINQYFCDVQSNSDNILNSLGGGGL